MGEAGDRVAGGRFGMRIRRMGEGVYKAKSGRHLGLGRCRGHLQKPVQH